MFLCLKVAFKQAKEKKLYVKYESLFLYSFELQILLILFSLPLGKSNQNLVVLCCIKYYPCPLYPSVSLYSVRFPCFLEPFLFFQAIHFCIVQLPSSIKGKTTNKQREWVMKLYNALAHLHTHDYIES